MAYTIVFTSPETSTASGLPVLRPDAVLTGDNDGVRFLFDLEAEMGWPSQANPTNGAAVPDIAAVAAGSVSVPGGTMAYSGNGFDLTATTMNSVANVGVAAPASVLNDLYTSVGGKVQRYLACFWVKLPTLANWNANATQLSLAGDKAFSTAASLFTVNMASGGALAVRRQTAAATAESLLTLTPNAGHYGAVVQVMIARTDSGQIFRIKNAAAEVLDGDVVGADNTQNFSANSFYFGRPAAFVGGQGGTSATMPALTDVRVYRGFIENLARSGRDALTVADRDYLNTISRGVFS